MKYIYGPVKSRRLGLSLGLSLTPFKICNFDCVYCQLGRSRELTIERKEYIKLEDILEELRSWMQNNPEEAKNLNYITISGLGEPTLNSRLTDVIREIRKISASSIAVITNSSLISDPQVRQGLALADLVVPSLDAVIPEVFAKVDRPHPAIKIESIIDGLITFRKEFRGKIWLEVMLASGINDDLRYIKKLKAVIDNINPDKVQINSPVRSTSEPGILPVDKNKLEKIKEILGDKCEII